VRAGFVVTVLKVSKRRENTRNYEEEVITEKKAICEFHGPRVEHNWKQQSNRVGKGRDHPWCSRIKFHDLGWLVVGKSKQTSRLPINIQRGTWQRGYYMYWRVTLEDPGRSTPHCGMCLGSGWAVSLFLRGLAGHLLLEH
jgi:hypothetical protein